MGFRKKTKTLIQKYKHAWIFSYGILYMTWFLYLEKHVTTKYYIIHTALDDKIPFVEYFIIPYLLWFLFMGLVLLYFFFTDVDGFYKLTKIMFSGMTLFLIISTVMPNGLELRPEVFTRDNIFVELVKFVYRSDTPTNVFPSLHVYNSLVSCIAIHESAALQKHKKVCTGAYILGGLIILSTVFLKQHSVIDVIGAFVMAYILYQFVYVKSTETCTENIKSSLEL